MRSWPLLMLPVGAFIVLSGAARPARAAPTLEWLAPSPCPGAEAVHRRIELQLGHALSEDPASERYAASISGGEAAPWRLELRIERDGASHTRELEAATCEALTEAAALLVVLALESSADARPPAASNRARAQGGSAQVGDSGWSHPDSSDDPREPSLARGDAESAVAEASSPRGELSASGGVDLNGLPGTALAMRVGVGLAWEGRYAVEGRLVLEPEQHFSLPSAASMDARVIAGTALGCIDSAWGGRLSSRVCLGAEVGSLSVTGYSAEGIARTSLGWGGPVGALGMTWSASERLGVTASVLGLMPLARHVFRFDGLGEAHRLPMAAVRLEVGLIASFGSER